MILRLAAIATLILAFVLVPFLLWEKPISEALNVFVNTQEGRFVVLAAVVLALSVDIFLPIPSSIVSVTGLVALGPGLGIPAIWLGMTVGCVLGYVLGRSGGAALASRITGPDALARAAEVASRRGLALVALTRPVPVLAEAAVLFAGTVSMHWPRFLTIAALANLGVALAYALIVQSGISHGAFLPAIIGAFVVPGAALVLAPTFGRSRL